MAYKPFGGVLSGGTGLDTPYRFTNQRSDESATGLYDYNARFYSPVLGRFVSADSIVPGAGNPQSLNRYAYAFNNPQNFIDPDGHIPIAPLLAKLAQSCTVSTICRGLAGGAGGGTAALGVELIAQVLITGEFQKSKLLGAFAGGFVAGALIAMTKNANPIFLGIASLVGGQVDALVAGYDKDPSNWLASAEKEGFLKQDKMIFDLISGAAGGQALSFLFNKLIGAAGRAALSRQEALTVIQFQLKKITLEVVGSILREFKLPEIAATMMADRLADLVLKLNEDTIRDWIKTNMLGEQTSQTQPVIQYANPADDPMSSQITITYPSQKP